VRSVDSEDGSREEKPKFGESYEQLLRPCTSASIVCTPMKSVTPWAPSASNQIVGSDVEFVEGAVVQ
jgi:hypothetical protein